jgi:hypothetical protein
MHCYQIVILYCSGALLRSRIDRLKSGSLRCVAHAAIATTRCVALNCVATRDIKRYLTDVNTLAYLRVVLKPNKRHHGSDFQRSQGENARTPGFNDKVQYKPGMWKGYAGNRYPTYPEATDLLSHQSRKCCKG